MGQTITQKILAAHCGRDEVATGEIVTCKVDLAMANDVTAPPAARAFEKMGAPTVWDRSKIALVASHFAPAKDIASATLMSRMRAFALEHDIEHYFEIGRGGIEHILLPEEALVLPGQIVIGADSHSCTYGALGCFSTGVGSTDVAAVWALGEIWLRVPESIKVIYSGHLPPWIMGKDLILSVIAAIGDDGASYMAMEHTGDTMAELSMDSRLTLTNMAIEAGAKSGIVPPDQLTLNYVAERQLDTGRHNDFEVYRSDDDAEYARVVEIDTSAVEPMVARPSLPSRAVPVSQIAPVKVDQVFIGSCTNARIEDLRVAAHVLGDEKVADGVRLMVIPATQRVWRQANEEGLLDRFAAAGASVSTPTCGACLGAHMGVLGPDEVCVSTSNRNYVGRMGDPTAQVYLANPAVAMAAAVAGEVVHPSAVRAEAPPREGVLVG
ncbi:MAG: 3-isopropylmalate/(R)-2-methylmalate dehydratase large subunit [Actinomycetota bacterium]|jgi:3-isopropylmalate/(R)-2-methylmalate dehydratase large subunit|nr:3-isopropylmalate/(R)-2-methylmalate dehydratase large subunit [Actinomycetota bacterium]